ncbi:MAG: hypothetical protein U9P90_03315 [Patescibacteria group bacterium]|nr:hypothetical protein [Patescibacteria group bacterium]
MKWTKSPNQDFTKDNRGWQKGRQRKYTKADTKRVKTIYQELKNDPFQFYTGATAIDQEWRKKFPSIPVPPLRTIGRILSDLELSSKRRKDRHRGASRYLCYPEHTIYTLLSGRVLEADFIGKKYITGRTEPLNFISFSFKKEPRLRYFKRIQGQTAENFIEQSECFFNKFEKPDFVKVDNALTMIGSASGKRNVSRVMKYLLRKQIIPIFAVPRKPFSQASIEGNNSVFSRKFWNRIKFKSVEEVDTKLEWFNKSSEQYMNYQKPNKKSRKKKNFIPKIYFIRQVREDKEQTGKAYIDLLNEKVFLPKSFINYFVLSEWNLKQEQLRIYFEKEQQSKIIKKISFKINQRSKEGWYPFI